MCDKKQIEFMAYQSALNTCSEPLNRKICPFGDMIKYINNEKYLNEILIKLSRLGPSYISIDNPINKKGLKRQRVELLLTKLLKTEKGADELLSGLLDNLTLSELQYIVENIINKYPQKMEQLCFKFVIKRNYKNINLSDKNVKLIESILIAGKLIHGA